MVVEIWSRGWIARIAALAVLSTRCLAGPDAASASHDAPGYEVVAGPKPGVLGTLGTESRRLMPVALGHPLQKIGCVSFWIKVDKIYKSGSNAGSEKSLLLESPGIFTASFEANPSSVSLTWKWAGKKAPELGCLLPEISGPAWYYLAFEWNGERGIFNGYMNGMPLRQPDAPLSPWSFPETVEALNLGVYPFAAAGLQVSPRLLTEEEKSPIGANKPELARLLGLKSSLAKEASADRGEILYENPLRDTNDLKGWIVEGPAEISFSGGVMTLKSRLPESREGDLVLWCDKKFPADFVAEWEIQLNGPNGLCIVFFSAMGRDGKDIFDPSLPVRTGAFSDYIQGGIECYHISYFANNPANPGRATSNLRRDPGFVLIANGPAVINGDSTAWHKVSLVKQGARIRMQIDGESILDYEDDGKRSGKVLEGGYIGFRQMRWTDAKYRDFRVFQLKK